MHSEPFSVQLAVRCYEIDGLGHVNHAVYHSYAEHARCELLQTAGCATERLATEYGIAPVLLETRVRFISELRLGDEITVDCVPKFGSRTFWMNSTIQKADGSVAARIDCELGVVDVQARKLVRDPAGALRQATDTPALLGIPERPSLAAAT